MTNSSFQPDWSSPPGETIEELLNHRELSLDQFAQEMGCSNAEADKLLSGAGAITEESAKKLSALLGATVDFWLSREAQYRDDLARLGKFLAGDDDRFWLKELPLGDMIGFGWIPSVRGVHDRLEACQRFFSVRNRDEWQRKYEVALGTSAFKTSRTFASQFGAVSAWLRQGEIESERMECAPWDRERFIRELRQIRSLTKYRDPMRFVAELRAIGATCGVAINVVRAPNGCRASGLTRFVSQRKAMMLLSFRHLSDDQFWFTFFHEASHLILHGNRQTFLEGVGISSVEEQQADDFAARLLIPDQFRPELATLAPRVRDVIRFSLRVGVSPGIVVGQLQHSGRLRYDQLNRLKRRYQWE